MRGRIVLGALIVAGLLSVAGLQDSKSVRPGPEPATFAALAVAATRWRFSVKTASC
jgi:hypothetical protein